MCSLAVDLNVASKQSGFDVEEQFADALDFLKSFEDDGSVHIDGYRVEVTEKGRPFVRVVASAFDKYLRPDGTLHSAAV
jgi:oxygen-independent coproporphyrinogen III oxidase